MLASDYCQDFLVARNRSAGRSAASRQSRHPLGRATPERVENRVISSARIKKSPAFRRCRQALRLAHMRRIFSKVRQIRPASSGTGRFFMAHRTRRALLRANSMTSAANRAKLSTSNRITKDRGGSPPSPRNLASEHVESESRFRPAAELFLLQHADRTQPIARSRRPGRNEVVARS